MPAVFGLLIVAAVFGGVWFAVKGTSRSDAVIKNSDSDISSYYDATSGGAKKSINEPAFRFSLPEDWKEISRINGNVSFIEWQSTRKEGTARSMKLYVDSIPIGINGNSYAVNKLVPVQIVNNRLLPGQVSAQCIEFNTSRYRPDGSIDKSMDLAPAKWQEAGFTCDIGNYLRNVIGSALVGGDYKVKLKGSDGKEHSFFFVYTDHTVNPNVQIMTQAIQSFEMK